MLLRENVGVAGQAYCCGCDLIAAGEEWSGSMSGCAMASDMGWSSAPSFVVTHHVFSRLAHHCTGSQALAELRLPFSSLSSVVLSTFLRFATPVP